MVICYSSPQKLIHLPGLTCLLTLIPNPPAPTFSMTRPFRLGGRERKKRKGGTKKKEGRGEDKKLECERVGGVYFTQMLESGPRTAVRGASYSCLPSPSPVNILKRTWKRLKVLKSFVCLLVTGHDPPRRANL